MYLSKDNNIIISPQIDSWAKENYPEEFLKLNNYILSLPNITDKRFKRSTEINIRRIKGNFFDAYNLMVSHNLDKELLFNEIKQNANAETVYDLTSNSSCFGFTPILYSPLGYKDLPLVMSARHIYLCTNPFGFYSDNLAHYHNLDISVLEDIPNNLNNVIFMYQGKRQTESIVSVLDYDIPIKDELGNITTNKTKLQLIIKPKPIGIKTFFSNLPIESNILATAFEFDSINNEHILYVNKNKKSLAQQLISHSIPDGRDRTEVVSNSGFYKKNIKYYIESVNKNLKLKESFLYNEDFIDRINLEIENTDNPDVEDIIRNINKNFLRASQIPQNIHTISDSVLSFENKQTDILDIIGKKYEIDATGKPTIKGMKALSRAMEIYSDKHFETARYLFVKDGTIVRHITISSHTPASTIIKPDDNFLYQLKSYAEETGSQIVFLHNHPSGYVKPSEADIELTEYINNFLTNPDGKSYFAGHIILDHGSYGLYDSAEHKWKALVEDKLYPIEEVKKHYKIQLSKHGKKVDFDTSDNISASSLKELSDYARKCDAGNVWNTKDWIPGFLITGNGIVTSLEHFNLLDFQNENILSERLKTIGRNYGSENILLFPNNKEQFMLCERFAQDTGKIKEVFLKNEDGTFEVSQYRNGNIFNNLKIDEIKVEDTLEKTEAVKNKILYEQSVNKDININIKEKTTMAKKIKKSELDITDLKKDFIEKIKAEMNDMESPEMSYYDFGNLVNKITSNNYSEEQKDLLNNFILDMSETDDIEIGIKYLQNRIETDIAIENGAAWEFNEKNEKVLKTSEPYTQQDKENSLSNNEKNIHNEEQKTNDNNKSQTINSTISENTELNPNEYIFQNGKKAEFFEQWQLYARRFEKEYITGDDVPFMYNYRTEEENKKLSELLEDIQKNYYRPELLPEAVVAFDDYRRFIDANHYNVEERTFDIELNNFIGGYEQWKEEKDSNGIKSELDKIELAEFEYQKDLSNRIRESKKNEIDEERKIKNAQEEKLKLLRTFAPAVEWTYEDGTTRYIYKNITENESDEITISIWTDKEGNPFVPSKEKLNELSLEKKEDYRDFSGNVPGHENDRFKFSHKEFVLPEDFDINNIKQVREYISKCIEDNKIDWNVAAKNLAKLANRDLTPSQVRSKFIEDLKRTKVLQNNGELRLTDFNTLVKDTREHYTDEQQETLSSFILSYTDSTTEEEALKKLEKKIDTEIAIDNGADFEWIYGNDTDKIKQTDKERSVEKQKTNYVLGKLAAAGVEVVTDKDKYQSMLSYVQEVNISLDMIYQNDINSQNLSENDKANLLLNLSEISKECQENVLPPNEFISKLTDIFAHNSKYLNQNLNESSCSFRISEHSSRNPDNNNLILKFSNINLSEFEYKPENLNLEKMQGIIDGLQNWLKTGEYTDKNYDSNYELTKEELQANLAEQLTLGGFKKTLLTGIALASMAAAGPKLYADTHLSKIDKSDSGTKVTVETQLQITELGDGYKAIINKGNKDKFYDIAIIVDENGKPTMAYDYDTFKTDTMIERGDTKTKSFTFSMDGPNFLKMMDDWKNKSTHLNIFQEQMLTDSYDKADYMNLLMGMINGGYSANPAEFFINDSITYGFALNNKVYLNPDVINSEVAVHEYTHIWDKYTQNTNPELWEKGKNILRNTKYWEEVKADPNYSNIANDDDLLLSEVHSRICGKMADKVLSRIAELDGKLTKDTVIDWDKETWNYICEEMMEGQSVNHENGLTSKDLSDFLSMPVKDLMQGRNITQQLDLSHEHEFEISEQNNTKSSISEYNDLGIDTRTGEPLNNTEDIESDFEITDSIDNNINFEEATDLDNTEKLNTPSSENELQNIINNLRQQLEQLNESFRLQVEENNKLRADIEMFKQNIAANKDVTANDSRSASNYSSPANSETGNSHEILYNKDGFGRDTAYKVNTLVPKFGHEDENGTLHIIKNARFAKLIVNEENIGQNTVILDITKEDGSHEEFKLPEKDYNDIINYEQELQSRIRETPDDSFAWMKAHMDYAQKMRIDENMYRLNTPENFIHNFRIHCRKDQAHNPNDALKIAGIMYDKMEPFDKERFLKMRRDWDKKMGKGSFDRNLIKEFNEYHPKNDIDISKVSQEQFSEEKAFNEMNPIISVLKPGDIIEGTHACVGDTFNFSMKLKSPDGSIIEEPKTDWKIARVCKNLYSESAVIFNEESKSYYTIPLDKLKEKIISIEKQQKKEQNKQFKKSNSLAQRQESNEIIRQEQKAVNKEIKKSRKNDRMVADSYGR